MGRKNLIIPVKDEFFERASRCAEIYDIPVSTWARLQLGIIIDKTLAPIVALEAKKAAQEARRAEKERALSVRQERELAKAPDLEMAALRKQRRIDKEVAKEIVDCGAFAYQEILRRGLDSVVDKKGKPVHPYRFILPQDVGEKDVRALPEDVKDFPLYHLVAVENNEFYRLYYIRHRVMVSRDSRVSLWKRFADVFVPFWYEFEGRQVLLKRWAMEQDVEKFRADNGMWLGYGMGWEIKRRDTLFAVVEQLNQQILTWDANRMALKEKSQATQTERQRFFDEPPEGWAVEVDDGDGPDPAELWNQRYQEWAGAEE